jgi:hypothetical protein
VRVFANNDSNKADRGSEGVSSSDDNDGSIVWQPETCFEAVDSLQQDLAVETWDDRAFSELVSAAIPTWSTPQSKSNGTSDYASGSSCLGSVSEGFDGQSSSSVDLSLTDYSWPPFAQLIQEGSELLQPSMTPAAPVAPMVPVAPMLPRCASHQVDTTNHNPELSNCLTKASSLLVALCRSKPFVALTLDTVLERNREVISDMTTILSCDCSRDGFMSSILGLVLLKLLAWYSAAASAQAQPRCPPSAFGSIAWSSSNSTSTSGSSPSLASPTMSSLDLVGYNGTSSHPTYSCGYEGGETVLQQESLSPTDVRKSAQVVMAELHKAQRLMKLLATRAEERRSQQDFMNIDKMSREGIDDDGVDVSMLSEALLSHMEEETRKRFRVVCAATIQKLRIL